MSDGDQQKLDEEIQAELERIARDVLEWEEASGNEQGHRAHWKPRTDKEHFSTDGDHRIVPLDQQRYHDLQLSRGACIPQSPNGQWRFPDPSEGTGIHYEINQERWAHLASHFKIDKKMSIMEIGVRTAHFLYFLKSKGYEQVSGIDCVRLNVLLCQKNGFEVSMVDAHELAAAFDAESKDVICMYHCLEHCHSPGKALAGCFDVLRRGGGLHLEIPLQENTDLATAHCYAFQPKELKQMLTAQGFILRGYLKKKTMERVVAIKPSSNKKSFLAKFLKRSS